MNTEHLKRAIVVFMVLFSYPAGEKVSSENSRTLYIHRSDVQDFANMMSDVHGFDASQIIQIINKVRPNISSIRSTDAPAEKVFTWEEYRDNLINEERIEDGRLVYQKYQKELQELEKEYGVPAEVLVAITGVETSYGMNKGNYKIISALTTLAFDYKSRKTFFTRELEHLFLLYKHYSYPIEEITSSYAGAFGIPQFMPSSYLAYAKQYSEIDTTTTPEATNACLNKELSDTSPNIFGDKLDAFASIANYLKQNGWLDDNKDYLFKAKYIGKQADSYKELSTLKPEKKYSELRKDGWRVSKQISKKFPKESDFLPIVLEEDGANSYYIANQNFYAISKYNPRLYYTMSVALLAQSIKNGK